MTEAGDALAVVGLRPDQLLELLGGLADDATPFLVGSLAVGFGNAASDVDVHLFQRTDRPEREGAPMTLFADEVLVDVQLYHAGTPAALVGRPLVRRVHGTPYALAAAPHEKAQKRIGRWLHALALDGSRAGVIPSELRESASALLLRGALEELYSYAFVAEAAAALDRPALLWDRAGRALLELLARSRGETYVSRKLLMPRLQRAGVDRSVVDAARAVRSPEQFLALVEDQTGLPTTHPGALVDVIALPPAGSFTLARRRQAVTRSWFAVPAIDWDRLSGEDCIASLPPVELLQLLAVGAVGIESRPAALDELLGDAP
jgi:hypothetical protein